MTPFLVFLAGLATVLLGAEVLLRSGTRIATMLGIRPIVIGLTVVSLGTSTPELAVGITAATEGRGSLAVGNIAGTNLVNILLILGLSAAIRPLPIRLQSVTLDVPVMIASAVALILMSIDGVLTRVEGALLVLGAACYTFALVRGARRESPGMQREFAEEFGGEQVPPLQWAGFAWRCATLAAGIAIAAVGANLLVDGAVDIAKAYGVTDAVIGLTIVAIGTSAPELATTMLATYRDDRDVAIGNLIGSSTYNILLILGLTLMASPGEVDVGRDVLWIDLPLAAAVAVACYPVFKSDRRVSRTEGIVFVTAYVAYLASILALRT